MLPKNIRAALNSIYNICYAKIDGDKTNCSLFNIKSINEHWDKQTVIEVKESVQSYLKTWVLPQILEELGEEGKLFKKRKLIEYHKNQIIELELEIINGS